MTMLASRRLALWLALIFISSSARSVVVAQGAGDEWRNKLGSFGREVVAAAVGSITPDPSFQVNRIRALTILTSEHNEQVWVVYKEGLGNELHRQLAARFSGRVSWKGPIASVRTDATNSLHMVTIGLPPVEAGSSGIDFAGSSVQLSIPFSRWPFPDAPAKGLELAFSGILDRLDDRALSQPVVVLYGFGSNAGKISLLVNVRDVEITK